MLTAVTDTMSVKYFDTLAYVQRSKELQKDPEALATYQVKQIESAIETAVNHIQQDTHSKEFATKTDLVEVKNELKADIADVRNELKADIADVRNELKADIASVRNELKADIADVRSELKYDIKNLEIKMEKMRFDMLKFIIWTGLGGIITLGGFLGGMLAKGFDWI